MGMGADLYKVHKYVGEWAKLVFGRPMPGDNGQPLAAQVGFAMALVLLRRHPEYAVAISMQEGEAADFFIAPGGGPIATGGPWGLAWWADEMVKDLPIEMAK